MDSQETTTGLPGDLLLTNGAAHVLSANGGNAALGATTDPAATSDTGDFSLIALFKRLLQKLTVDGSYTTPTHTAPSVTTVDTTPLAANANRLYAIFVNDSDTPIYLAFGATAVANTGIRVNASGGNYEMSKKLGNLYTGAIHAIHAGTGNKVLLVTEGV